MVELFVCSIYALLGILIVACEVLRIVNREHFNYLTIFNIYFFTYYILPSFVKNAFSGYESRYSWVVVDNETKIIAALMICVSYLFVRIGFKYVFKVRDTSPFLQVSNDAKIIKNEEEFYWKMIITLWVIGIASFVLYAGLYGGVSELFFNSALIRNGDIESSSSSLEFIGKLIPCLMYAAYIVYIKFLRGETSLLMLLFSFALASVYLIIHAGRSAIITFVIILFLIQFLVSGKRMKLRYWVLIGVLVVLGVNYLRPLLIAFGDIRDGFSTFVDSFLYQINVVSDTSDFTVGNMLYKMCYYVEHKYTSLEVAIYSIEKGNMSFTFFRDVLVALISVIPQAILPFKKPTPIAEINTELLSQGRNTGTVPPGGVAFGYYSLGFIGVALFSLVIGIIGRRLSTFFKSYDSDYGRGLWVVYVFMWVDIFINGDLRQAVLRNLVLICMFVAIKIKARPIEDKYENID